MRQHSVASGWVYREHTRALKLSTGDTETHAPFHPPRSKRGTPTQITAAPRSSDNHHAELLCPFTRCPSVILFFVLKPSPIHASPQGWDVEVQILAMSLISFDQPFSTVETMSNPFVTLGPGSQFVFVRTRKSFRCGTSPQRFSGSFVANPSLVPSSLPKLSLPGC